MSTGARAFSQCTHPLDAHDINPVRCAAIDSCSLHFPQLGRFTLRDEGKTIGIGKCLKVLDDDEAVQQ